tara:strand:+ start:465 stop:674 length:210 start_codon:yes stop_codon:yes gene_type:complete
MTSTADTKLTRIPSAADTAPKYAHDDLLAALKSVVAWWEDSREGVSLERRFYLAAQAARVAIAKAEGAK